MDIRWKIYNWAFLLLGRTRFWPVLGQVIWH